MNDKEKKNNHRKRWFLSDLEVSLFRSIHASSFVMLRIMVGCLCFYEIYDQQGYMLNDDEFQMEYSTPLKFHYRNFSWIPYLSTTNHKMILRLSLLASIGIITGTFYRLSTILYAICFTYIFLSESVNHLNHLYLFTFFSWIMTLTQGNTYLAMDPYLGIGQYNNTIHFYNIAIIRLTMTVIYIYAAIAKINYDWVVLAIPLRHWLMRKVGRWSGYWFSDIFDTTLSSLSMAYFMSISGLLYDLLVPLMFYSKNKYIQRIGLMSTFVFHFTNKLIFNIGIFPYLSLAISSVYLDSRWPIQLKDKIGTFINKFITSNQNNKVHNEHKQKHNNNVQQINDNDISNDFTSTIWTKFITITVTTAAIYQILMPLRHHFYYGDVTWNELGHQYSWRMKLRTKDGYVSCSLLGPDKQLYYVNNEEWLMNKQITKVMERSDHIEEYAHHLSKIGKKILWNNTDHVPVYCASILQLNHRSPQWYMDPRIDLAEGNLWTTNEEYIVDLLPRDIGPYHPLVPWPFQEDDMWRDQSIDTTIQFHEIISTQFEGKKDIVPKVRDYFIFLEEQGIIGPPKQKGGVHIIDAEKAKNCHKLWLQHVEGNITINSAFNDGDDDHDNDKQKNETTDHHHHHHHQTKVVMPSQSEEPQDHLMNKDVNDDEENVDDALRDEL